MDNENVPERSEEATHDHVRWRKHGPAHSKSDILVKTNRKNMKKAPKGQPRARDVLDSSNSPAEL